MTRYFTLVMICLIFAPASHASRISPAEFEQFRGECLAVEASGTYGSVDNEKATKKCLSACHEGLDLSNGRKAFLCNGAYDIFKQTLAQRFDAPIARVAATVDYASQIGWKVMASDNAQVSQYCDWIRLAAAKSYPTPMKGHQMMMANINEVPVGAVETPAVLINVRIEAEKTAYTQCTAEVVFLHCPPHRATFDYCNP